MSHLNVEIKARCHRPDFIRNYLKNNGAIFKGVDHQTDTYFHVAKGRLKLREGSIENNLIYYERDDQETAKESEFQLVVIDDTRGLKEVLSKSLGVRIVVQKKREIYFIGNIKFHIDEVVGLGSFTEIEASNLHEKISKEELRKQCNFFMSEFGIEHIDLIAVSYSDMLLAGAPLVGASS